MLQHYPLERQDAQREKMHMVTSLYSNVHEACFDKCAVNNELTFMSVNEGKCFRNCITKFSYWHPTLGQNLKDASFRLQDELTEKIRAKNGDATPDLSMPM